ncbi:nitrate- and nitrite sensing domain-containing protein [Nocardiopsis sp. FIRDI 009]|uniref:sensor histidine kinase n=1 Tax=Nocardiopsis sp. FIRDI 009 TaxID=714197 RepID=UPI0018E4F076|nr:nitrate- and nitrite sensing domain-containing protein [Nocardiopsis sp. FIRDI 009]
MPHEKRRSLRARMITLVLVPSTALLALWAGMTTVMVLEIDELRTTAALTEEIGGPVVDVVGRLQRERRATMDTASPTQQSVVHLALAREDTDEAVNLLRRRMDDFVAEDLPAQALGLRRLLDGLDDHRDRVDALPRTRRTPLVAGAYYDQVIETGLRFWDGQVARAHPEQTPHLRSLTSLMRTRELLNQQDTVVAHAVAVDAFTADDHARFSAAVGAQEYLWDRVGAELSEADLREYVRVNSYSGLATLHLLQDTIVGRPPGQDDTVPVNAPSWRGAAEAVDLRMREAEQARMESVAALSHEHAAGLTRVVMSTSVLVLLAALASTAVAVVGTQRVGVRLQELRTLTLEHARVRLPEVTARLRAGGSVDVDAEVPRLRVERRDEIGEVAEAFNDAQRAAVTAAVEEAQVRAGVRAMFRNLARRTQSLVHRQLGLLDSLERGETDPEVLSSLFRIDHFSTQMRRNAENLVLLSGDAPVRAGLGPVGLHEAVRAAASEIEDYTRVRVLEVPGVWLRGEVGAGTVRLLAELLENAAAFSPPETMVTVRGRCEGPRGYVLEVEDRGLGMTGEQRAAANALLADPPRFDLARMREDSHLGLFVAATIAVRHGFGVHLEPNGAEGTRAVVVIPSEALTEPEEGRTPEETGPHTRPAAVAAPVAEPDPPAGEPDGDTYMGLPRRRGRRSRSAAVSGDAHGGRGPGGVAGETGGQRSLSEIRSMMSAFQSGTLRGRAGSGGGEGAGDARGARPGEETEG